MGANWTCESCWEEEDPTRHYVASPKQKKTSEENLLGGNFLQKDLDDDQESKENSGPYMDVGADGEQELVISLEDNGFFVDEFVPPSDMPSLFRGAEDSEMTVPSDLPKLFNSDMGEQGDSTHAEEGFGPPKTEEEIEFLIKSVQYSRLMSAIQNETKLRDVVKTMKRLQVKDGDVVIQQGDTDNVQSYYVLESGAIDVFVFDQFRVTIQVEKRKPSTCKSCKMEVVEPGWCFGELSFVFGAPRSASCIASADSVLWVLDRAPFDRLLAGLSPLDSLRIVRQQSDPGDEFDADDAALSALALESLYGADFFEDKTTVRNISAAFMSELASHEYVGLPEEVKKVMQHFSKTGDMTIQYDTRTHAIVGGRI